MFRDNKANAKMNLQGRYVKSFLMIFSCYVSIAVFISSCFSCVYLLVINTEFLGELGVFDNRYIHAAVCAFAVIENIILFMLHIYIKLKKDIYFYFIAESVDIHMPVGSVYKASCVYSLKAVKKILSFLFYLCPFAVVSVLIFYLLQSGVSYFLLILFIVCASVLLIIGLHSYAVYIQKYEIVPLVLIKYQDKSIKDIFVLSERSMNGKCKNLLRLKMHNFPKKLLCLFVFPSVYLMPYCKAVEADFVSQKEKPYMRRKAHTEKPIVFYFKPIKEN